MLIKMVCTQCGAPLEADDAKEFVYCMHCGTRIMLAPQRYEVTQNVNVGGTVVHRVDNTGQPNLIINFSSTHPAVGMVVRIVSTGMKSYYINGQSMSYHLPYGVQRLVLKIGKINYERTVVLPSDNAPVTIYASWSGRAHITIDQPPYNLRSAPPQQYAPQPVTLPPQGYAQPPVPVPQTGMAPIYRPPEEFYSCPNCGNSQHYSVSFCAFCGAKNPNSTS